MTERLDAVLRYQLALDGLGRGLLLDLAADIDAALRTVERELARRLPADAPFTYARFQSIRGELTALREALSARLRAHLDEALDAVIDAAPTVAAQSLDEVRFRFSTTAVPVQLLAAVKDRPFDGKSWGAWADTLATDAAQRLGSELRQALALGETMPEIRKRFATTAGLSRVSAERLARTAVTDVATSARIEATEALGGDLVRGWQYVATLDSRTSLICAGLDGKRFRKGDPALPRPPRHPNCRSTLVPLFDMNERLDVTRASEGGQVSAGLDFAAWFKRQPRAWQEEFLGPTRFAAWRRGVPLDAMSTASRPLTVAELRKLYPRETPDAA